MAISETVEKTTTFIRQRPGGYYFQFLTYHPIFYTDISGIAVIPPVIKSAFRTIARSGNNSTGLVYLPLFSQE